MKILKVILAVLVCAIFLNARAACVTRTSEMNPVVVVNGSQGTLAYTKHGRWFSTTPVEREVFRVGMRPGPRYKGVSKRRPEWRYVADGSLVNDTDGTTVLEAIFQLQQYREWQRGPTPPVMRSPEAEGQSCYCCQDEAVFICAKCSTPMCESCFFDVSDDGRTFCFKCYP